MGSNNEGKRNRQKETSEDLMNFQLLETVE